MNLFQFFSKSIKILIDFFTPLIIAGTGVAFSTFLLLIFTSYYWGIGIISLGMIFYMGLIAGSGSLILAAIFRNKSQVKVILITGSYSFMVALGLIVFQLMVSSPNELKNALLPDQLESKIQAKNGRLIYTAFEHEIYLELLTDSATTGALVASEDFQLVSPKKGGHVPYGFDWFPSLADSSEFTIYKLHNIQWQETYTLYVSKDQKTVFYYYLNY